MATLKREMNKLFFGATYSRTATIIIALMVIVAIPLTVYIAQQQQDIRQRAATNGTAENLPAGVTSLPAIVDSHAGDVGGIRAVQDQVWTTSFYDINIFDTNGSYIKTVTPTHGGLSDITVVDSDVWVTGQAGWIQIFDTNGTQTRTLSDPSWCSGISSSLDWFSSAAVIDDTNVWVLVYSPCNADKDTYIKIFKKDGTFIQNISTRYGQPNNITVVGNQVWVQNYGGGSNPNTITEFTTVNGLPTGNPVTIATDLNGFGGGASVVGNNVWYSVGGRLFAGTSPTVATLDFTGNRTFTLDPGGMDATKNINGIALIGTQVWIGVNPGQIDRLDVTNYLNPPTPTPTPATTLSIEASSSATGISLIGIGDALSGGNPFPTTTSRNVIVCFYDTSSAITATDDCTSQTTVALFAKTGTLQYDSPSHTFITGTTPIDISGVPTGNYKLFIKVQGYLRKQLLITQQNSSTPSQIISITADPANQPNLIANLSGAQLIPGDINGDNKVDIADYSILTSKGCWEQPANAEGCQNTDYDDRGTIDVADYNLLIRGLTKQYGD